MKLIFIYGSPAVGKYTVANAIAKLTDFKVCHNHLSIDCLLPVFEFGSPPFERLIVLIRREMLTEAARENINTIFTYCYAKDQDDANVTELTEAVTQNGGEVCYVFLKAEKAELEKRVVQDSRKVLKKIRTVENLHGYFEQYELFTPLPHGESLVIDNTNLSAEIVAKQIIEHFNLVPD
jgi:RNase adaptor protein for sRNA GlmZ degradation